MRFESEKRLMYRAFHGLVERFEHPESTLQFYTTFNEYCCEVLEQRVVGLDSCTSPSALLIRCLLAVN